MYHLSSVGLPEWNLWINQAHLFLNFSCFTSFNLDFLQWTLSETKNSASMHVIMPQLVDWLNCYFWNQSEIAKQIDLSRSKYFWMNVVHNHISIRMNVPLPASNERSWDREWKLSPGQQHAISAALQCLASYKQWQCSLYMRISFPTSCKCAAQWWQYKDKCFYFTWPVQHKKAQGHVVKTSFRFSRFTADPLQTWPG